MDAPEQHLTAGRGDGPRRRPLDAARSSRRCSRARAASASCVERLPGIAPNILTDRLRSLERDALVVARPYSHRPPRSTYELTAEGRALAGAVRLLSEWGARHGGAGAGPPRRPAARRSRCAGTARRASRRSTRTPPKGCTTRDRDRRRPRRRRPPGRRRPPHAGAALAHARRRAPARACHLKAECLQRGGAFKFRGAYNMISTLPADGPPPRRRRLLVGQPRPGGGDRRAACSGRPPSILMPADTPGRQARRDPRLRRRGGHLRPLHARTARRSARRWPPSAG